MSPQNCFSKIDCYSFTKDLNAVDFFIQQDVILDLETGILQVNIF